MTAMIGSLGPIRQGAPVVLIGNGLFLGWAVGLQQGLERFFRHAKDADGPVMREWVVRGVEGLDPTMDSPTIMPRDPLAAAERFMAMLLEPTAEGAKKRRQDISVEQLAGGDPAPWLRAVMSLRDGGSLSADEAMHFVFDLVAYSYVGLRDAEVQELTVEMERIEQANGIAEDDGGGELLPEWVAAERRYDERLQKVRVAYLRRLGAHEAAALLERSYATFEEAADRGNEEFRRRWSVGGRQHD
jgi:hypothetical protein